MLLPLKASVSALQKLDADISALPELRCLIVDLRPAEEYDNGHIPGAVWLDSRRLNRSEKPMGGLLPGIGAVNAIAADLGLKADQHIVAYDAGGSTAAARLVWVLNAYGWDAISWLDGGFAAWLASGADQGHDSPAPIHGSDVSLSLSGDNVISTAELMQRLEQPNLSIIDVRSHSEYEGSDVRSEFGGHMPRAVHYEWTDMLDKSLSLRHDKDIQQTLDNLGVSKDDDVVVYCQTHQRSAVTYVALKNLGYKNVIALDGAWSNWGNDAATPKVQGSKPSS
ncbi:MAG: rhodanese-like domain-containing protein [Granulosicoccaceae bacterium]